MKNKLYVKPGSWVPAYVPEGYTLSDFQRFEVYEDGVYGVLYSGVLVECSPVTKEEKLTWLDKLRDMWRGLWLQER